MDYPFFSLSPPDFLMKFSLLLLLLTLTSAARANNGIRLNCPTRGDLTVSFFDYSLMTMKWGNHFQIAAGRTKAHTKSGAPFWSARFRNGDELAFFPDANAYYLFYAGSKAPVRCTETGSLEYPAFTPPRYEKKGPVAGTDNEENNSVVLLHPAT